MHVEQPFPTSYIPEGTSIAVHPYTVHRDPRYFSPYPTSFWPDRWLASADRKSLHDVTKPVEEGVDVVTDTAAFIPFSTGPRNCPGRNLGLMELRTVVSYIVQRFDMEVAEGYELDRWEGRLKDSFIMAKGALPVVLTPRSDSVS
jgi:cytochrome P450